MKTLPAVIAFFGIAGCAAPTPAPTPARAPVSMETPDVQVAARFMNSLFRPGKTTARIIADAASETSPSDIPVAERNRDLRKRLSQLRRGPDSIRLVLSSDHPPPGYHSYDYDRAAGTLRHVGEYETESRENEIWMHIRHWPDHTTLVSLKCGWISDGKDSIFHLPEGENTIRFAAASAPIID